MCLRITGHLVGFERGLQLIFGCTAKSWHRDPTRSQGGSTYYERPTKMRFPNVNLSKRKTAP